MKEAELHPWAQPPSTCYWGQACSPCPSALVALLQQPLVGVQYRQQAVASSLKGDVDAPLDPVHDQALGSAGQRRGSDLRQSGGVVHQKRGGRPGRGGRQQRSDPGPAPERRPAGSPGGAGARALATPHRQTPAPLWLKRNCLPTATEVAPQRPLAGCPPPRTPQPTTEAVGQRGKDTPRGYPNTLSGAVLTAGLSSHPSQ